MQTIALPPLGDSKTAALLSELLGPHPSVCELRETMVPLGDSDTAALLGELLGHDPSVDRLAATILSRVGGNPFFDEEIVRDLTERGLLRGQRGAYVCQADVT